MTQFYLYKNLNIPNLFSRNHVILGLFKLDKQWAKYGRFSKLPNLRSTNSGVVGLVLKPNFEGFYKVTPLIYYRLIGKNRRLKNSLLDNKIRDCLSAPLKPPPPTAS